MTWQPSRHEIISRTLADAPTGTLQLDEMLWEHEQSRPSPAPEFQGTWRDAYRQGRPGACLTTNPGAALKVIEAIYDGSRIDMRLEKGLALIKVDLHGPGWRVGAEFKGPLALSELGIGMARAFFNAHERAVTLTANLASVAGVLDLAGNARDWPVERRGERWYPVHHELQLAGHGMPSVAKATEYGGMLRRTDEVIYHCRERYLELFAVSEPAIDAEPGM
jgi:hypothetical protein